MTNEQRKEKIAALLRELHGYERYGREDRAAEVKAQLDALGHRASPPARRATRMDGKQRPKTEL